MVSFFSPVSYFIDLKTVFWASIHRLPRESKAQKGEEPLV